MIGFVKLHRKIREWEWYDDINTKVLFLHLLITANYQEKNWRGITIKRGELITSINNLATETKLSPQKVRSSLNKLKSTNELTIKTTNKYTIIKLENYSVYQDKSDENNKQDNEQLNNEITNDQQTNNKQITTTKESKEDKEYKEDKKISKRVVFAKPSIDEISIYCNERGNTVNSSKFWNFYESKGWKVGKNPMKDWKAAVRNWEQSNSSNSVASTKANEEELKRQKIREYYKNKEV